MAVDIYDFDKTVVPYDSGSTFFFYCLLHYPYLILLLPFYLVMGLGYVLHLVPLRSFKAHIFLFVRFIPLEKAVHKFWDKHEKDVRPFALPQNRARTSVLISASPDFLLEDIVGRLQFDTLLCTHHDRVWGTMQGENCKGQEKIRRFYEEYGQTTTVEAVYSDSYTHDQPIFSLGRHCVHLEKDGTQTPFSYSKHYQKDSLKEDVQ